MDRNTRPTLEETLDAVVDYGIRTMQFNLVRVGLPELPERIDPSLCDRIRHAFDARNLAMAAICGHFNMIDPDVSKRPAHFRNLRGLAAAWDLGDHALYRDPRPLQHVATPPG